jgi:hypothetical protein
LWPGHSEKRLRVHCLRNVLVGPGNSIAVQREGVAMTHFDGAGNLWQVDFVLSSPNAPAPRACPQPTRLQGSTPTKREPTPFTRTAPGHSRLTTRLWSTSSQARVLPARSSSRNSCLATTTRHPHRCHLAYPSRRQRTGSRAHPQRRPQARSSPRRGGIELRLAEQFRVQPKEDGRSVWSRISEPCALLFRLGKPSKA